jgi:hypothetical protein
VGEGWGGVENAKEEEVEVGCAADAVEEEEEGEGPSLWR